MALLKFVSTLSCKRFSVMPGFSSTQPIIVVLSSSSIFSGFCPPLGLLAISPDRTHVYAVLYFTRSDTASALQSFPRFVASTTSRQSCHHFCCTISFQRARFPQEVHDSYDNWVPRSQTALYYKTHATDDDMA